MRESGVPRRILPPVVLLLATSCASPPEQERSWVWILTGPQDAELSGEAREQAFAGHFANMERMAKEGALLLAGPLTEPKVEAEQRGIFVFATADTDLAWQLGQSDPAVAAGIFDLSITSFRTTDPLERVMDLHAAAVAGVEAAPPGYHARPYVLLLGRPARAARRALDPRAPRVLFAGVLSASTAESMLYCLDARDAGEARAFLDGLPDEGVEWSVMPWFASEEVVRVRTEDGE